MNSRIVAVLAVLVFGVVAGAIWFLQSNPMVKPEVASATPAPAAAAKVIDPATIEASNPAGQKTVVTSENIKAPATPAAPMQEWEVRINQVLSSNANDKQIVQMFLNMMPTLPVDGQVEAAHHMTNLLQSEDYALVLPLLKNPAVPTEVQDVLVTDLMNREDNIKLPALLDVAKIPNHSYHDDALTTLQVFLDEDNGNDWGKWDRALAAYLKKQADDEAGQNATAAPAPAAK